MQLSVTFFKTFVPTNSVSITRPVSRYWEKLRRRYFWFPDFWTIPYKPKLSHSRICHDIGMKLRLEKHGNFIKNCMMKSCQQILTSFLFFQFMANLEQSGSRIRDTWSVKLKFSLIVAFYLTRTESRTKKSLEQSFHAIALSKGTNFVKKCWFFCKQKMLTSAKLRGSW